MIREGAARDSQGQVAKAAVSRIGAKSVPRGLKYALIWRARRAASTTSAKREFVFESTRPIGGWIIVKGCSCVLRGRLGTARSRQYRDDLVGYGPNLCVCHHVVETRGGICDLGLGDCKAFLDVGETTQTSHQSLSASQPSL